VTEVSPMGNAKIIVVPTVAGQSYQHSGFAAGDERPSCFVQSANRNTMERAMNILVTGHSRGLGAALTKHALASGHQVYGLSRSLLKASGPGLYQGQCDLARHETIVPALTRLVPSDDTLEQVYLNAGVLGRISALRDSSLQEIATVMDINVWANKLIIDWLAARTTPPRRIVLISSGAGVVGHHGWGAYALSKAALNMLAQLYAHDMPATQLLALAPGLVDTDMQAALRQVDGQSFPSVKRLHAAYGSAAMPGPATVAAQIDAVEQQLAAISSGSFVDLRNLL
jgi:benzil reductase ((S)-benzoin forming)